MNRPDRRPWTAQFMGGFQEADRDLTMEKVLLFFFLLLALRYMLLLTSSGDLFLYRSKYIFFFVKKLNSISVRASTIKLSFCWPGAAAAREMQQPAKPKGWRELLVHGRIRACWPCLPSQERTEMEIFYESGAQSYPGNSGDSDIKALMIHSRLS
ncbi:hypothetical protein PVAP13_9NG142173 [Panicum virgatum]|uniref:Uncharacterized protein n=1 Tax=Panicum virgatum TaxID=38727 RepID=A0A8T0MEW2_PANVG|nr:hypothetical protein PVAP13_9NG142173 [Panicum virgatum]